MVHYINGSQADKNQIFQAFKEGFSDYIIKLEPAYDFFFTHFFGAEGNDLNYSWLALDGDAPIGLILGGIRFFDGLKTMRCGTMCVIPEYRGKGISLELLKLHRQTAQDECCDQMFLECIVGNDKALHFYKKNGYVKVYDLSYYKCTDLKWLDKLQSHLVEIISFDELKTFRDSIDIHSNWQNETDYIALSPSSIFGIKNKDSLIAAIAMKESKIQFLYVRKSYRNKGYARQLISKASGSTKETLTTSFPNNASLEGYFRKLGFQKEEISQVEMYGQVLNLLTS